MGIRFLSAWALLPAFMATRAHAQPGALDTSFGTNGMVHTSFGPGWNNFASTMVVQPDGRIVVAGELFQPDVFEGLVVRYMPDGTLDAGFGDGGVVRFPAGDGSIGIRAIALQADGKLVLAGSVGPNAAAFTHDTWFGRLNADGSVDTGFGTNGRFVMAMSPVNDLVRNVVVGADGSITGLVNNGSGSTATTCMVRLTPAGQLDNSFSGDGVLCDALGSGGNSGFGGGIIRPDGGVVGVGRVAGTSWMCAVLPNGTHDAAFGTAGVVQIPPSPVTFWGLGLRPDGRLLSTGSWSSSAPKVHLTQVLPNGSLDPSFGNNGVVIFEQPQFGQFSTAAHVLIYPDGRFMLPWTHVDPGTGERDLAITWFNADGSQHPVGTVVVDVSPFDIPFNDQDGVVALAMAPDGGLIALASYVDADGYQQMTVLRFHGDLQEPTGIAASEGDGGLAVYPVPASDRMRVHAASTIRAGGLVVREITGRRMVVPVTVQGMDATIDVSGLTAGYYLLELHGNERPLVRRFQVVR